MTRRTIIALLVLLSAGVSFAQLRGSPEKSALRNIEKHRWQKTEASLRKALGKDTLNPGIRYVLSIFYFTPENPAFHLDSAYHYAVTALDDYASSSARSHDRLNRISIDSIGIVALRAKIDSAAFEVARKVNTEAAYLGFLSHFPTSVQRDLAEHLRDEVAFQDALRENTHQAFLYYLNRYPESKRSAEARAHYDRLLYQFETRDHRLSSYEKFLTDYPETPYRDEIYAHIFEISAADGSVESLMAFTTRYPVSALAKRARQLVFHILADDDAPHWPQDFLNDSLQHLLAVNNRYLVPVLKNNLYGFIDQNGKEVLPSRYEKIDPDYLCGYVTDDVLNLDDQLIARSGALVYAGKVDSVSDLGIGFLKIKSGEVTSVIHKSGFIFEDSVEDARVLGRQYIALKKSQVWHLYALTGRLLDGRSWDEITAFGNVIVFRRNQKAFIVTMDQPAKSADGLALKLSEPFDEVRPWPRDLIWGRSGEFQGVLNRSLQRVIGFDKHTLTRTFFGAIAAVPNGFTLYNWAGQRSHLFENVQVFQNQVGVKRSRSWFLFDPDSHRMRPERYDTLRAEGPFIVGTAADTVFIHFEGGNVVAFRQPVKVSFIPGRDSTSYLVVDENAREKNVFDLRGKRLFSATFDAIDYAGQGMFVVTRKGKKGLLDTFGKSLLRCEYDAIGSAKDQVLSTLRNKYFGAYHISHKKLIRAVYDRNLIPYNEALATTYKDGHYGFLGWDSKPFSAFEFDEITYWDDSVALVRKGSHWNFYDIFTRKMRGGDLRKIIMVKDTPQEKIAIIQKDGNYGVISNHRQDLIPVTFSAVMNLGSADEPLYFTEKHIWEASLIIVMYYDRYGNMLRKEIYDDAADYDKIYCSDN